ncbi:NDMA-dependent alcohol dehydrogenase [Mycolicibacterium fluoranthenivorans]|uniref:alcohol dehydrogenase n=1 Tax=Mycolicibacterium fluoranthenivorans TaxID=258505 RepID=A0A7X5ZCZ0_9MYCO|nr:NDMA-dependent alcohol dehydrogenase [Mycolicibacterium fluoranthenivorans]MCV7358311.1 NDMA-dependent alcohol dehydrogenase [Mycolicibacterium fluoranthenivorans]NIH95561.1 S-(hydroxymethyl)glutathione dehydrogenase/alcohol dehydrogenase [Mycolicibacterium fluoranthenivorans]
MLMDAAVLWGPHQDWSIEEVELDGPRAGEVLVAWQATGLCHSDHHPRAGEAPAMMPTVGGHEGAGIVEEVGPGVTTLKPGDHVVGSFIPACGRCRWCSTGRQNLCDMGALIMAGPNLDGTFRRHARGQDIGALSLLGTFAPYGTVPEASLVKIDDDHDLTRACLIGCGVTTGWGSAVNTAAVAPGDTVVVIGVGGIGAGAIQGAAIAGAENIIAVDLVADKRDKALSLGATHFATSFADAAETARELTRGVMADSAILTVGRVEGPMIGASLDLVRKAGAVVLTALAPFSDISPTIPLAMFTLFQKRLLGSLFGEANPRADIPRLLSLYRQGKLKLDEVVTNEYKLQDINVAYDDMLAGRMIRGIVKHQH